MELKVKIQPNKFKTAEKKDENKPDYTGLITLDAVHQLAVWKNDDGSLYLQLKPKEDKN